MKKFLSLATVICVVFLLYSCSVFFKQTTYSDIAIDVTKLVESFSRDGYESDEKDIYVTIRLEGMDNKNVITKTQTFSKKQSGYNRSADRSALNSASRSATISTINSAARNSGDQGVPEFPGFGDKPDGEEYTNTMKIEKIPAGTYAVKGYIFFNGDGLYATKISGIEKDIPYIKYNHNELYYTIYLPYYFYAEAPYDTNSSKKEITLNFKECDDEYPPTDSSIVFAPNDEYRGVSFSGDSGTLSREVGRVYFSEGTEYPIFFEFNKKIPYLEITETTKVLHKDFDFRLTGYPKGELATPFVTYTQNKLFDGKKGTELYDFSNDNATIVDVTFDTSGNYYVLAKTNGQNSSFFVKKFKKDFNSSENISKFPDIRTFSSAKRLVCNTWDEQISVYYLNDSNKCCEVKADSNSAYDKSYISDIDKMIPIKHKDREYAVTCALKEGTTTSEQQLDISYYMDSEQTGHYYIDIGISSQNLVVKDAISLNDAIYVLCNNNYCLREGGSETIMERHCQGVLLKLTEDDQNNFILDTNFGENGYCGWSGDEPQTDTDQTYSYYGPTDATIDQAFYGPQKILAIKESEDAFYIAEASNYLPNISNPNTWESRVVKVSIQDGSWKDNPETKFSTDDNYFVLAN